MPPRRPRPSAPPIMTPAASIKSESGASTPGTETSSRVKITTRSRKVKNTGLVTPISVGDEQEMKSVKVEVQELEVEVSPTSAPSTPAQTSAETSPTPSSRTSTRIRYKLDSVQIPSSNKRSRLGVEKTTSADNLTLTSTTRASRSRASDPHSDPIDSLSAANPSDDAKPSLQPDLFSIRDEVASSSASTTNGPRPAHQPFNIGKFSRVQKASAASLALDVPPKRRASARGKGKAAIKKGPESFSDTESEAEGEQVGDDFAMDSEEETAQLKRALKASKSSGKAESSSKAAPRGTAKATRGPALNGPALRRAAAKAAESE
ncbi:hypothetical protein BD324DRAFT_413408 [Kockovaella imperatae]|uniref:Uncharacterized protein n=1 Tax=Kockovaella imperatae TaxID=4999 RepID=A0A1Y1UJ53_9TREE|nr:hypothetical protein BD324DRAFT_413408 [Kockovaella imperatae]ORX37999.1 hypothetical protein BD324DRAFT_413408 [Kockovaella imperatae]